MSEHPERCYHGSLVRSNYQHEVCRIAVEVWDDRSYKRLRDLKPRFGDFGWGRSNEHGPQRTADAILTDALGEQAGIGYWGTHRRLAQDFCEDVIAHLPRGQEWRLGRQGVLLWVRGWHVGRRERDWPDALVEVGPVQGLMDDFPEFPG